MINTIMTLWWLPPSLPSLASIPIEKVATFSHPARAYSCLTFSFHGNVLATGSDDGTIKLWDLDTRRCVRTISAHSEPVLRLAFTQDGTQLVSGADDSVRFWNLRSGKTHAVHEFPG